MRSPHAHARIVDIDVTGALDVDGLVAIYTYEDLSPTRRRGTRVAEPLPLLIPHPTLTHGRTQYALANGEVNHVGEAIVMVVAVDRYAAEDACRPDPGRLRLPAGRRRDRGRPRRRAPRARRRARQRRRRSWCRRPATPTRPSHAAPHSLELDLAIERSASMPMEGKGVLARWDADDQSLRVHTSTQTSTSVRQAIAAKLALPVDRVEVVTPDVGGGFGVKIVHPWPEEVLVPVGGAAARPTGEVDRGPPRALHRPRPRARPAAPRRVSGSTTTAGCSACRCSSGTTTAPTRRTA